MARKEARLQLGLWCTGLDGLSAHGKLMYCVVVTEKTLTHCGVGALRVGRWAKDASLSTSLAQKALDELVASRHVLVDEDTEEVLVRTFIRGDGIIKQPQMMKSALREALTVESPALRAMLAAELRKLGRDDAAFVAEQIDPYTDSDPDPHDGSPIQADGSLPADSEQPSGSVPDDSGMPAGSRRGRGRGSSSSSVRSSSVGQSAATRGTRLPEDFTVTQAMVVWARRECPDVDGRFETAQFIDYWTAKAGKEAVKLDWPRTWQTWMRKSQRDAVARGPRIRSVPSPLLDLHTFDDYLANAAATEAARLLRIPCVLAEQPPSDRTPAAQWQQEARRRWIAEHERQLRAALAGQESA